jgi:hypothetical protein
MIYNVAEILLKVALKHNKSIIYQSLPRDPLKTCNDARTFFSVATNNLLLGFD